MEAKKTNHQISNATIEQTVSKKKSRDFIAEMKAEFQAINWTSKEELITYTKIVVGATFVMGLGIYAIDLAIQLSIGILSWLTRAIAG